jgi:hypothetical protein
VTQWSAGTNNSQEYLNGIVLGTQGNPELANPGFSGAIDNPRDPYYVPDAVDQLGPVLANYYGALNPLLGVDLTALGVSQWDLYNITGQGGSVASNWIATQDFSSHAFTWGGSDDPHTTGAFQFSQGMPPMGFAIVAPATTVSGTPFSITVEALDPTGKLNPAYAGTVHFTTTDADQGVVLPSDYTYTSNDAGQHTFDDVTLVTPGDQLVAVTDLADQMTSTAIVTVLEGDPPAGGSAQRSVSRLTPAPNTLTLLVEPRTRPAALAGSTAASAARQRDGSVAAAWPGEAVRNAAARSLAFAVPESPLAVENLAPPGNSVLSDLQLEQISQAVCGVLS